MRQMLISYIAVIQLNAISSQQIGIQIENIVQNKQLMKQLNQQISKLAHINCFHKSITQFECFLLFDIIEQSLSRMQRQWQQKSATEIHISEQLGFECKQQMQIYVQDWIQSLEGRKLPITMRQFETSYKLYKAIHREHDTSRVLYEQFKNINIKSIWQQFIVMWHIIFIEIEPHLKKCFKQGSLKSVFYIIQKNLNPDIFGTNYKLLLHNFYINKQNRTVTQNELKMDSSLAFGNKTDKIFAQLFQIMFQTTEKICAFYGINRTEFEANNSPFEALQVYLKTNPQSQFIKKDNSELEENRKKFENSSHCAEVGEFLASALEIIDDQQNQTALNQRSRQQTKKVPEKFNSKILQNLSKLRKQKDWGAKKGIYPAQIWTSEIKVAQLAQHQARFMQNLVEQNQNLSVSTLRIVKDHLKANFGFKKQKMLQKQQKFLRNSCIKSNSKDIAKVIEQGYRYLMAEAVNIEFELEVDERTFMQLKMQVINQLMRGVELTMEDLEESRIRITNNKRSLSFNNNEYATEQCLSLMTLLYKAVQKNYDPYRRRLLKRIYRHFNKQNGFQIDSIAVLRVLQNQSVAINQIPQVLQTVRNSAKFKRVALFSKQKRQRPISNSYLAFEDQINRIYHFQFKEQYEQQKVELVRLSKPGKHNKVVNLLISGFLSQDTDKIDQWKGLIDQMPDSQIYAVCWASKTSKQMFQFAKDALIGNQAINTFIGGPYMKALRFFYKIYQIWKQNPFQDALKTARPTGYYLAEIIISTFRGHIVNLMAFSLGTQVLLCTLQRLNDRNSLFMVNKIVTMGGAADVQDFTQLLHKAKYPLDITNLFSDNDLILRYVFRISRPFSSPIGINEITHKLKSQSIQQMRIKEKQQKALQKRNLQQERIDNIQPQTHTIRNVNCTDFIESHTSFRANMRVIGKIIDSRQQ